MRLYGRTPFWSGSLTICLPGEASEGDTEAKLTFPPCLSSGGDGSQGGGRGESEAGHTGAPRPSLCQSCCRETSASSGPKNNYFIFQHFSTPSQLGQ